MVGALGTPSCEVLLPLASDIVWLQPPANHNVPTQDKMLDGVVEIECPVGRRD